MLNGGVNWLKWIQYIMRSFSAGWKISLCVYRMHREIEGEGREREKVTLKSLKLAWDYFHSWETQLPFLILMVSAGGDSERWSYLQHCVQSSYQLRCFPQPSILSCTVPFPPNNQAFISHICHLFIPRIRQLSTKLKKTKNTSQGG